MLDGDLADIVEYFEHHNVADGRFISGLKMAVKYLQELEVLSKRSSGDFFVEVGE